MRLFRHVERGSTYAMLGRTKMQIAERSVITNGGHSLGSAIAAALEKASFIVYRAEADGTLWVRPETEFFDGRFVEIE